MSWKVLFILLACSTVSATQSLPLNPMKRLERAYINLIFQKQTPENAEKERILRLNFLRLKSLPKDWGPNYVLVDIADFKLHLIKNHQEVLSMRAIVGDLKHPTPPLTAEISQIVLNPIWHIPQDIALEEAVPEIQEDPSLLKTYQIDVFEKRKGTWRKVNPSKIDWKHLTKQNFPYEFRQHANNDSPLGAIKFYFNNPYRVFLHGTADTGFFEAENRSMSHGCVRLEKPLDLALALLPQKGKDKNQNQLLEKIHQKKEVTLDLPSKIPVYLIYATAWVDEKGNLSFRKDLYGWDSKPLNLSMATVSR